MTAAVSRVLTQVYQKLAYLGAGYLRTLPQTEKQTLFAACVARTMKGQLAFEPQARPELEATVTAR